MLNTQQTPRARMVLAKRATRVAAAQQKAQLANQATIANLQQTILVAQQQLAQYGVTAKATVTAKQPPSVRTAGVTIQQQIFNACALHPTATAAQIAALIPHINRNSVTAGYRYYVAAQHANAPLAHKQQRAAAQNNATNVLNAQPTAPALQ